MCIRDREWKANAAGVDLNRNFDAGWESLESRSAPSSEDVYKRQDLGRAWWLTGRSSQLDAVGCDVGASSPWERRAGPNSYRGGTDVYKRQSSMNPTDSFAWRSRSMIDAWGKVSAEGRQLLFGDSNKSYFTGNESNLSDYIVTIQVRTWDINSAGQKYTRTWNLEVNRMVADEVKAIFEEI